jgi:hypothetical protein
MRKFDIEGVSNILTHIPWQEKCRAVYRTASIGAPKNRDDESIRPESHGYLKVRVSADE